MDHARLFYSPKIYITAEQIAKRLDISLERADKLLSQPDAWEIFRSAISQAVEETLDRVAFQLTRMPTVSMPTRVDCHAVIQPIRMKLEHSAE